ncbi:helix-turn-helix domain-containing protein [Viridibacillus arvi]|jgi:DNA-binding HxlR family transcriptional regulator|uniref:HxlR family transcriptional regulator n=1 Tax=Viridibacillus arvi TaxID=263475 RepID=A0A0M0L869_9BACL|nr:MULTISPECIES: helix-turn-helix domain-containing protein [Viridibacillus]KOO47275.1 HxlR family transcriptional regulator [Viridibacillus arvi]QOV09656.1 helix-turn-helix transcriptional regulator [Viridibacillus sp. JNUCC-6]
MLNGQKNPSQCQMVVALNMIVGKWKPIILDHLLRGEALRFNELKKLIPDITQRMLTMHLRELEEQDILTRTVYPQVPPKVEYQITEYGMTLQPILTTMQAWGAKHIEHMKEKVQ